MCNPTTRKFLFRCYRPSYTHPGSRTEARPSKSKKEKKRNEFPVVPALLRQSTNQNILCARTYILECAVQRCGWVEGPYRRPDIKWRLGAVDSCTLPRNEWSDKKQKFTIAPYYLNLGTLCLKLRDWVSVMRSEKI